TESILYGDALQAAARWVPLEKVALLGVSLVDLTKLAQMVSSDTPVRPTGRSVLDGTSKNIPKDRLILRLDDAIERGDRGSCLELMAVILGDQGLSHTLT